MKFIKNNSLTNGSRLLIARLDLSILDHLYDIRLNPEELNKYRNISHDKRKCEFLSIRKAIQFVYDEQEYISYSSTGKPSLAISGHRISISHSKGLLGIITHPTLEVGIDLQHESPKILRIKHRFMSPEELTPETDQEWPLLTYWCAKEALFKYYSKGNVEFNKNLFVEPFTLKKSGTIYGEVRMPDMHKRIALYYEKIEETMMVYTNEVNE
ncbi:MAG: 4'-phosphopantetheinyl transferase [Salibacteraceae bacterium]|jgi:4'-phosphopantetheinyl transferase EntD